MPSRTLWISIKTNWNFEDLQLRQQFNIKVSFWRFYNRQEEVLDQKLPKVIDHFVFNYLAVENAGQTLDNKHTGSMIFGFFLQASKTDKPLGDNTFQNQSVNLICWQAFSFIPFFVFFSILLWSWNWCFLMLNSRGEISTRFTNDICLVVNGNTQVTEWHVGDQ